MSTITTVETATFKVGRYTVHQRARFDNPAWPQYLVMLGSKVIGKQFSMPSETDCERLRRESSPVVQIETRTKSRYGRPGKVFTRLCARCESPFVPRCNGTAYCPPCRPLLRKAA